MKFIPGANSLGLLTRVSTTLAGSASIASLAAAGPEAILAMGVTSTLAVLFTAARCKQEAMGKPPEPPADQAETLRTELADIDTYLRAALAQPENFDVNQLPGDHPARGFITGFQKLAELQQLGRGGSKFSRRQARALSQQIEAARDDMLSATEGIPALRDLLTTFVDEHQETLKQLPDDIEALKKQLAQLAKVAGETNEAVNKMAPQVKETVEIVRDLPDQIDQRAEEQASLSTEQFEAVMRKLEELSSGQQSMQADNEKLRTEVKRLASSYQAQLLAKGIEATAEVLAKAIHETLVSVERIISRLAQAAESIAAKLSAMQISISVNVDLGRAFVDVKLRPDDVKSAARATAEVAEFDAIERALLEVMLGEPDEALAILKSAEDEVMEQYNAHAFDSVEYQDRLKQLARLTGDIHLSLQHWQQAIDAYTEWRDLCDKQRAPLDWAYAQQEVARVYRTLGHTQNCEPMLQEVVRLMEKHQGDRLPIALSDLGLTLYDSSRYAEAETLLRRVLAINESTSGPHNPKVAVCANNLASVLIATNRYDEAEPLIQRALSIDEAFYGPQHVSVARDLNNLACLLKQTNRLHEAEPLLQRAVAIKEVVYGSMHPNLTDALTNLASLLHATNRLDNAESLVRRALLINEAYYGSMHPNVANSLNNLAHLLQDTNRMNEAASSIRRALSIYETCYGPEDPNVVLNLGNLSYILQSMNRYDEAESFARRALSISETIYGPEHISVFRELNLLAKLLYVTNRLNEAEPLLHRILKIIIRYQLVTGHRHPKFHDAIQNWGGVLIKMGLTKEQAQSAFEDFVRTVRETWLSEQGGAK
ncbi:tetratricopeptide repeat protein [Cerasicoccus fimbriatus]|uniref:tetratricopeptide repeat protein n=1 Tax=Cerasicoccus fimbriatus TaxID=3014554 RepID=UPI0022B38CE4|nr:tetratricopeptide repeat protein [Cerasicoccus sp. TK19100]